MSDVSKTDKSITHAFAWEQVTHHANVPAKPMAINQMARAHKLRTRLSGFDLRRQRTAAAVEGHHLTGKPAGPNQTKSNHIT